MARVYDALKRVEEERRRLTLAPAMKSAPAARQPDIPAVARRRKWWQAGWRGHPREVEAAPHSERTASDHLESVLARLDRLETQAAQRLPRVEEHLRQVTQVIPTVEDRLRQTVEARLRSIEDEYRLRLIAVGEENDRRVHQINTRLAILFGTVLLLAILVLFRV